MLEGRRIAILAEEGFDDVELTEPLRVLRAAGATVLVVGSGCQPTYRGKHGIAEVSVDVDVTDVGPAEFDAVVVPGGYAPDKMSLHPAVIEFVRAANDAGKIIAAICLGPRLLVPAGVARGRRLTSWPSLAGDLRHAGATWVYEPVVQDGNLITSRKSADLPLFDRAIVRALQGVSGDDSASPIPGDARRESVV